MSAQDVKYGPAGLTHRTELVIGKGWNISGDSFDPACILNLAANDFTNKNKSLSVYPNPVNSILNFSEEVSNIKITDVSGKVVKQNFASGKSVDIADLKKGIYIITSTTKSGDSSSKKIIKD